MNNKLAYFYAIVAIIFWSTSAVAFKIALRFMDFIQLLFFSTLTSSIFLFVVLVINKKFKLLFSFKIKEYLNSVFLGFLNPFAYYIVLLKAYSILPAQIAQPLNYTWPILLVILSVPLLKQKLSNKSVIALIISFLGVLLISSKGNFSLKLDQPFGVFLASGSAIIWALFWIYNVKDKRNEILKLALSFFFSLFFISLAISLFSKFSLPNTKGIIAAIYIGFFEMGFTFILWLKAISLTNKLNKISNLVFISPFLSLIWIHLFLGENILFTTIFGLILIISGIFIQLFRKAKE